MTKKAISVFFMIFPPFRIFVSNMIGKNVFFGNPKRVEIGDVLYLCTAVGLLVEHFDPVLSCVSQDTAI